MSTTMQLSDFRLAVRQRADMVNSSGDYTNAFIPDPELDSYINQSAFELYDLLVQKFGDDYYVATPATITTDGVSQFYPLPADFFKLLGVDLQIAGPQGAISLKPFSFSERNRYTAISGVYGRTSLRYRLNGNNLWLTPLPQGGLTLELFYIPRMSPMVNPTDTFDGISGWTEYVICDAAIKCLEKEESDCSLLMAQKQGLLQRIEDAAENRDPGAPQTVADTQRMGSPYGSLPPGWDV